MSPFQTEELLVHPKEFLYCRKREMCAGFRFKCSNSPQQACACREQMVTDHRVIISPAAAPPRTVTAALPQSIPGARITSAPLPALTRMNRASGSFSERIAVACADATATRTPLSDELFSAQFCAVPWTQALPRLCERHQHALRSRRPAGCSTCRPYSRMARDLVCLEKANSRVVPEVPPHCS